MRVAKRPARNEPGDMGPRAQRAPGNRKARVAEPSGAVDIEDAGGSPDCDVCKHHHPFLVPPELVSAIRKRRVLVFAGAGISTESHTAYPATLSETLADDLGLEARGRSFPALMSTYQDRRGRARLLQEIKSRLDYAVSFPEVKYMATRFHREMSTIPMLDAIVTTNWDTFFEDMTGATPMVIPEDYAFWDFPGRKVYKIHGSITNLGSVVATTEDYAACYRRLSRGIIGASLKHLLGTRIPLFVGYSFGDEDFQRIYRYLRRELKAVLPRAYIVTLDHRVTPATHDGASVIHTDASYFMSRIKTRLVDEGSILADERFDGVARRLDRVIAAHRSSLPKLGSVHSYPTLTHAYVYLDGQRHGLQRILAQMRTGEYSHEHDVYRKIRAYDPLLRRALSRRKYTEVAYITGYQDAMLYLLVPDHVRREAPTYFAFGAAGGVRTLSEFRKVLHDSPLIHKAAYQEAKRWTAVRGAEVVPHHWAFLDPDLATSAPG